MLVRDSIWTVLWRKKKVFEKIVPFSNYIYAHRVRAAGACQRFGGALGYRNSFEIVWEN